ncbi:TRAP transporter fused permease subunit [Desulfuromonas acetoxidans]|uniref:TRAP transporter, 4TM/12TM fusion protein n=1 Tax=Desulfuromonas acetoxidans (strain DSM 684 / 11070) TaxID=281689 RepID=Q1K1G9_DESA6|nr:TRAP transporter fused permease subunit [Desulfuromonas acetoxidans]EAT16419.1 TRAP transporter, 4TM/12TM fusion protein [Desulfuromonas acetoxidans DSM 684]MBF0644364.1 TRAP transporter fused permease subunit [Desulfuromonas acetoxidans]NVD23558.1 TRAP transporter fused permease subunit [Desulfuromonas acetoxidans]NVE16057.1 TRAP transporter fused permease subunit [Desulfuromonas acetoxidans]
MDDNDPVLTELSDSEQERLQELMEKDNRKHRVPTGLWHWIVAALGGGMVLFYLYTAGLAAVATQFHRGVYVFVTYVLVFLMYPAGRRPIRAVLTFVISIVFCSMLAVVFYYDTAAEFHQQLMTFYDQAVQGGLGAALAAGIAFWPLLGLVLIVAAVLYVVDGWLAQRWPENPNLSDVLYAMTSALVVYYWIAEFENLNYRAGAENDLDALVSLVGILLSLEVCRRVLGWPMTCIGMAMLAYGYFGPYLPDVLAHRGFDLERMCTFLFLTPNGVFGVMANVLATYVILFIFFGAFLHKSGAGKFFIDLPLAVAGRSTGGPAKVAVIASALFGSVSGSAIANTVSTGAFTIPLMKKAGFKPHVAGAIEPSASIGGMFLPPIMGAGGFLMAELTNTPYATIMMIAVAPALLYFFSVFCMIHFEARKQGLKGIKGHEFEHWKVVLKREWYFSLPLVIITVLMIMGRSPGFSAFWATLCCIGVSWVRAETRMGPKEIWEAIQTGAQNTLIIGATLGVIGIIVGIIALTGVGLKFSDIIISLAQGNLLAAVFLVALASLVLGMGVPVTAAYLITAVLAVPPLVEMGVPVLAAHMIVYWFSQDSNITPPVCVAAYAGAAIAGADPWKTGWTSFKFAKLLYVMPILFAFTPAILFQGKPADITMGPLPGDVFFADVTQVDVKAGDSFEVGDKLFEIRTDEGTFPVVADKRGVIDELNVRVGGMIEEGDPVLSGGIPATGLAVTSSLFSAFLGTIAFSALTMFYWLRRTTWLEWFALGAATILLYWPTLVTDLSGAAIVAVILWSQNRKNLQQTAAAT